VSQESHACATVQRTIEELTLNAWPALQTVLYDGWLLRFAEGYTRRANSVNPIYPSAVPLADKIAACERAYAARDQDAVFKITDAADLSGLDAALEQRGYQREATTSVQTCALATLEVGFDLAVAVAPALTGDWLDDFCQLTGTDERHQRTMRTMIEAIGPVPAFATLRDGRGRALAVGLAVAERDYVGLFDVATAAPARNQGTGRRLVGHLLAWGRAQGARTGHLAVVADNTPALRLYACLGFREAYRYWYRRQARQPHA